MQTTLTREELLEAQEAFNCKIWRNNIQEILDSTNDENIEIEDKYLDLIKEEATLEEVRYCKALNLDLKWNIPEEAKDFVLDKIKSCEMVKYDKFGTYYQENGKTLFYLNSKTKYFWFDYDKDEIEQVLKEKYSLKLGEIRELINSILEEYLKLKGYTSASNL